MFNENPFRVQPEKLHHSLVFINPAMYLYHHTKKTKSLIFH